VIDQWLVAGDVLFTTHRDRAWYLGKSAGGRAQWLKENAGKWRRIQDVQQEETAPLRPLVDSEIHVRTIPAEPSSHTPSRGARNDGHGDDDVGLADISAGDCSPPHQPAPALVPRVIDAPPPACLDEREIAIGARRYVSARRVASMLGVSIRTLSRWNAAGTGPPKIKVGKLILFDLGKLPEWLASRETRPAPAAGHNTQGGSYD
jgi:predicted DNA-binding transcriptional regulator AlpA